MRLCSYVVVHDYGFSPNPFGGACTLAACTPNHMGIKLKEGDWIVGNSGINQGQKLIYAMRVSEVMKFDEYFHDPRFQDKKPAADSWETQRGDNIYFKDDAGEWKQQSPWFHTEPRRIQQDTRHARVFISDHFYYFGREAPRFPEDFGALIHGRQGCKCSHSADIAASFVAWLEASYRPGIIGLPRDETYFDDPGHKGCTTAKPVKPGKPGGKAGRRAAGVQLR